MRGEARHERREIISFYANALTVQAGHRLRFRPGTSFTLVIQILFSKFVVVAAVGTVEKRLLFFHGFHSRSVEWFHLAPCQPVAGLMFLVLSSSIPRR